MCKVMVMTGIKESALALDFMKAVAPNMSIGNTDGIGYSAINSKNELFMEKWHNNKHFLNTDDVVDQATVEALKPFENRIGKLSLNYTNFGTVTRDDIKTVTMHTRFATCGKTFENTHPFIEGDTSLIHNGVISNSYTLGLNKNSTCDSENALQLYVKEQTALTKSPELLQNFLDQLKGYWAFAFLSKNTKGIYQLDVVREGAQLYFTKIEEIGENCVVFATTKEIIETGVKALGLPDRKNIFLLVSSNYHRFNALTGDVLETIQLEESILNASAYSYNKAYGYGSKTTKKDTQKLDYFGDYIDDMYDSYSKESQSNLYSITDENLMDSFFDINEPLVDRLDSYDKIFDTQYLSSFEDLPIKVREFVNRQEDKDVISFDNILEMIDAYNKNNKLTDFYNMFRAKRRSA